MGKQEDHETALLQRFAIFETVMVVGGGEQQYNMVQRTDGTFLIVPRFLTAGVVTKRFQLKVKETGKQAVRLCLLLISLHSG